MDKSMLFPWQSYAQAEKMQTSPALRDAQGNLFSWLELGQKIQSFACALHQQGVRENSGVALCGKNNLDLLLLYLASLQLGARVLGINPAFALEKVNDLFQQNQIQFFYCDDNATHLTPLKSSCQLIQDFGASEIFSLGVSMDFHRPATLTLTSGSTGLPKAVVHSLEGHLSNAQGVCQLMQFEAQSRYLLSLPLYHVSGQGIVWRWLLQGATLLFSTEDFYASLMQATHASLVPTQAQRFLQYLKKTESQERHTAHILLGGASIPVALTQALKAQGIQSYCGYGMTEMASTVFAKPADEKSGVGQALQGREYRLEKEEIQLKGAGLGLGYWQNGKITPFVNQDGYFPTKDKGCWQEGELHIIGRMDNQFISGGENIQPEEIERKILNFPRVKQVFVLPKNDLEFGQRPVAMIEFDEPFNPQIVNELKDWLGSHLEKFKHPVAYYPLDSETYRQQGSIKISRKLLQSALKQLIE